MKWSVIYAPRLSFIQNVRVTKRSPLSMGSDARIALFCERGGAMSTTRNDSVAMDHRAMSKSLRNEQRHLHRVAMMITACRAVRCTVRVNTVVTWTIYELIITSRRAVMQFWTTPNRSGICAANENYVTRSAWRHWQWFLQSVHRDLIIWMPWKESTVRCKSARRRRLAISQWKSYRK